MAILTRLIKFRLWLIITRTDHLGPYTKCSMQKGLMVGGRSTYSYKVNQVLPLVNHNPIKSSIHTPSIPSILSTILIILLILLPGVCEFANLGSYPQRGLYPQYLGI